MASNQVTLISGGGSVIVMNYTGNCLNFGLTVERTKSIGIHVDIIVLSNWPVPGNLASNQLKPDELGLGMGIHNESDALVVLFVNNSGGIPLIELNLVVKEAVDAVVGFKLKLKQVYAGSFLASLNMSGFSITLFLVKDEIITHLLDQKMVADSSTLEVAIRGTAQAVIKTELDIAHYDTLLGDGNCGQTLKTAALAAALDRLPSYPLQSTPSTVLSIAETIENSQAAAHHALQALMTYTKARVGDRTLMDMLCPFIIALNNRSLEKVVELVQLSASSTRTMSSHLGRSSYLSNQNLPDSNVPDAGAYGLAVLLNEMV
ncbi:hypothetical protein G6F56_005550 [Rhizopus delemar]|nr:hypothetical protein G6F56_005550 [Rhizopus delemar]